VLRGKGFPSTRMKNQEDHDHKSTNQEPLLAAVKVGLSCRMLSAVFAKSVFAIFPLAVMGIVETSKNSVGRL